MEEEQKKQEYQLINENEELSNLVAQLHSLNAQKEAIIKGNETQNEYTKELENKLGEAELAHEAVKDSLEYEK